MSRLNTIRSIRVRSAIQLLVFALLADGVSPVLAASALSATPASCIATRAGVQAFGGLTRAAEFGIKPYGQLASALKNTGLQAHHLIEQRFAALMGQSARQGLSVAVTRAEHQAFTNAWRQAIPYGAQGTGRATQQQVLDAARRIYANHPEIMKALGL